MTGYRPLAELVRELKAEGRIVAAPSRAVELQCYRAVLARLVEIDARIPQPWPRPVLYRMAKRFALMQRRAERGLNAWEIRRDKRRRLYEDQVARWHDFRVKLAARISPSLVAF